MCNTEKQILHSATSIGSTDNTKTSGKVWSENYVDCNLGNMACKKTLGKLGLLSLRSLRKDVINVKIFKMTANTWREIYSTSERERALKNDLKMQQE